MNSNCLIVEFCLYDTLGFDFPNQILQRVYNVRADIAADHYIHNIVSNGERAFVQPDPQVINTVHPARFRNCCIELFPVIGKSETCDRLCVFRALADWRTTPLWTRYMPILPALSSCFASFSYTSIDGLSFFMFIPLPPERNLRGCRLFFAADECP